MPADDTITLSGTPTQTSGGAAVNTVIPRRLGHVSLIRELGQGGMGTVWLARDEMLGRDVAVKFLLNAVTDADDPGFARFLEGARAAATLRHPGLTAIHAAELINGVPYQVMEFVDGPTVARVLERCGPLPKDVAHAIIDAVADAIGMLHERGIVHRDIKPSNVLLDGDGRVFVTDFGLTCRRATPESKAQVAGTPAYMAPEMFEGQVSPKSDVYALGVMLYEMLTGERPFATGRNSTSVAERGPMPRQPLASQRVPDALMEVIERALNVNPLFRHKSAANFRQAVDDAMGSRPDAVRDARSIAALVARVEGQPESTPTAVKTPAESTPTYFDSLAQIAARKRGSASSGAVVEPSAHRHSSEQPKPRESASHLAAAVMSLHPTGRLPDDRCIPCVSCGYDVRGQEISSRCPECGMAIVESALPDRLVFSDMAWLRRVTLGIAILRYTFAGGIVVFALLNVIAALGFAPSDRVMKSVGLVMIGAGIVVPIVGAWLSTALEPHRPIHARVYRATWVSRAAILFLGLLDVFTWFVDNGGSIALSLFIAIAQGAAFGAGIVYYGELISRMIARIPDAKLSGRIQGDSNVVAIFVAASPLAISLEPWIGRANLIVIFITVVLVISYWWRMGHCEQAIRKVAKLARDD